jgi:hypothetical protein
MSLGLVGFTATTGMFMLIWMICGWPIVRLLGVRSLGVAAALAPGFGVGVLVISVCGYVLVTGNPAQPAAPWILGAWLAAGIGFAATQWHSSGSTRRFSRARSAVRLTVLFTVFLVAATYPLRALTHGTSWIAASPNGDLLSYLLISKHLSLLGPNHPGNIIGYDAGHLAKFDVFGSVALHSLMTRFPLDEVLTSFPLICALGATAAMTTYYILREGLRAPILLSTAAALIPLTSYIGRYETASYFLAEKIAILIALSGVSIAIFAGRALYLFRIFATTAITSMMLALTYPQFLVISITLIGGVVSVRQLSFSQLRCKKLWAQVVSVGLGLASTFAGAAIGLILLGDYALQRLQRINYLRDVVAGWPMPNASVADLAGMGHIEARINEFYANFVSTGATSAPSINGLWHGLPVTVVLASIAIPVITIGVSRLASPDERMKIFQSLVFALPLILLTYIEFAEPGSYRQWKMASYVQPFVVIAIAALSWFFIRWITRAFPRGRRLRAPLTGLIAIAWIAYSLTLTFPYTAWIRGCDASCAVSADVQARYEEIKRTTPPTTTAVDLPFWATMLAAYYIDDRPLALRNPSYYPASQTPASYTIRMGSCKASICIVP